MRKAVFVYELHDATPAVNAKVHADLGAARQFQWTGVHSTWEYTDNSPGKLVDTLFLSIETNFGVVASNAGASKWDLKMWGAEDMRDRSSPRPPVKP